jgi:hypothetical protein
MYSRRHFIKAAAAGLALSPVLEAKINSRVRGVYIGLQTYTLRGLRYDAVIPAMKQVGLGECELWSTQVEPTASEVADLAKWRATVSLDFFTDVRKKFNEAGIEIYAYNPRFGAGGGRGGRGARGAGAPGAGGAPAANGTAAPPPAPPATPPPQITDDEIDRLFQFTKALGAKTVNSAIQPAIAGRVAKFAEKYKKVVGITNLAPEVLAMSKYFRYDIDTASYLRMGHDPLQFVKDNHDQLTDIHLNDTKSTGPSVPLGQGDAHIKEILLFLKEKKSHVRANIDSNYAGSETSVEELQKCYDYVKACLA